MTRRNWQYLVGSMVLALGLVAYGWCQGNEVQAAEPPARSRLEGAHSGRAGTAAQGRVGSIDFHLEIARLYQRYQDHKTAARHFAQAIELAKRPEQRVQAYVGLAQLREAQSDRQGAIEVLEEALAEIEKRARRAPEATPLVPRLRQEAKERTRVRHWRQRDIHNVFLSLGRLYAEGEDYTKAESVCKKALAGNLTPFARSELLKALVEIYRQAGTLAGKIAETEKALQEDSEPKEAALRFLAIAYGGGDLTMEPFARAGSHVDFTRGALIAASGPRGPEAPQWEKLVPVYKRLAALRPDGTSIYRLLILAYERAGLTENAANLIREAPCTGFGRRRPIPPELAAADQVIRLYMRGGKINRAQAEIQKLLDFGAKEQEIYAYLVVARIYADQGDKERAENMLVHAAQLARSTMDHRELSVARADLLMHGPMNRHKIDALKELYASWTHSENPCVRAEGVRRQKAIERPIPR